MAADKEKKLQVRDLRISFKTNAGKVQAVRGISFDLYKGETLAIVGESGSGKSVTTKAILGIQAANAIYEGGEILYDGMDLLRITEEDFYRLRGDKIAMIFQDPLSSLNPIMRIGKQLTEAMLLKGKARQRSCRESFNRGMKLLTEAMIAADPSNEASIRSQCAAFNAIESCHSKLEQSYSAAHDCARVAAEKFTDLIGRVEKGVADRLKEDVAEACALAEESVDEFVIAEAQSGRLKELTAAVKASSRKQLPGMAELTELRDLLSNAVHRTAPDFMALGYCRNAGISVPVSDTVDQMNAFCEEKLREGFLNAFLSAAEKGMRFNAEEFRKKRETALAALRDAAAFLCSEPLDEKRLKEAVQTVSKAVDASINPMLIVKDSPACIFSGSMRSFVETYETGLRTNGAKQRKFDRQTARYNALAARGKTPDWKVAAASTIDLKQVQANMQRQVSELTVHYEELNAAADRFDAAQAAADMIDFLKENASGMVHRVTKHMAKQHALELMAEVGIPEPRQRYRAYPFQFSGGMRQRIVIAIALAANPDILICDEPTTALDVTIQAQILELINKLKRERNLSIIFITHDLGVVANMADRIAVMYAGKIVEYGTSSEVFYSPAHPYTWALLSSMPDLDTKDKLEAIPGTPPNMIYPPVGDAFAARNKYAMQIDFEQQPPQFDITPTHWAATWLLHPSAPHLDPPAIVTSRIARMKARNAAAAAKASEGSDAE